MTTVFLVTFFVGFGLTVISAVLGLVDAGGGHVGHGHGDGLHLGHGDGVHGGHGHSAHMHLGHGDAAVHGDAGAQAENGPSSIHTVSPINFQSLVAFLMGFGGVGYLLLRGHWLMAALTIPLAILGGAVAAWLIYRWLRLLVRGERPMEPTSLVGVIGTLGIRIREGGTGEIVYTQNDTRKVLAARSVSGEEIPKGTEVVILRYAEGVAYVQRWQDFLDTNDSQ